MLCDKNGKRAFPVWAHIVRSFSDLFLVINVSTNSIVYFSLNSTFRKGCFRGAKSTLSSWFCSQGTEDVGIVADPDKEQDLENAMEFTIENGCISGNNFEMRH